MWSAWKVPKRHFRFLAAYAVSLSEEGRRERERVVRGEDVVLPPHRQGLSPTSEGIARARERGREREGGMERGRESPRLLPLRTAWTRKEVASAVCPWWMVDSCMARLGALGGWWIRAWRDLVSKECTSKAGP